MTIVWIRLGISVSPILYKGMMHSFHKIFMSVRPIMNESLIDLESSGRNAVVAVDFAPGIDGIEILFQKVIRG